MKNKKCVLILPYFGKFNNYFPLFLRSCGMNPDFEWIIFTDNKDQYNYPDNVHKVMTTLAEVKEIAERKFGFPVCLNSAYKLCDYKPAYGFLFEEYIVGYRYWGHCDCDLIFGKMDGFLDPLFDEGFDKIFAAGHLTLYKNSYENNRRFMKPYNNRLIYKEAFQTDKIYVFDEDIKDNNVHKLFLAEGVQVFQTDLSMNASPRFSRFRRSYYNIEINAYQWENFKKARYFWNKGHVTEVRYEDHMVKKTEYLYMHLQMRKMRVKAHVNEADIYEIMPDRFVKRAYIPINKSQMRLFSINFTYLRKYDELIKKIRRKLNLL